MLQKETVFCEIAKIKSGKLNLMLLSATIMILFKIQITFVSNGLRFMKEDNIKINSFLTSHPKAKGTHNHTKLCHTLLTWDKGRVMSIVFIIILNETTCFTDLHEISIFVLVKHQFYIYIFIKLKKEKKRNRKQL